MIIGRPKTDEMLLFFTACKDSSGLSLIKIHRCDDDMKTNPLTLLSKNEIWNIQYQIVLIIFQQLKYSCSIECYFCKVLNFQVSSAFLQGSSLLFNLDVILQYIQVGKSRI